MFIRNIGVWERSIFDVDCFPHKHHRLNIDNIIIIVNMTITLTMFIVVVIIIIYRLNENVCWCCCCWCWVGWCCFFFVSTELVFWFSTMRKRFCTNPQSSYIYTLSFLQIYIRLTTAAATKTTSQLYAPHQC